MFARPDLQSRLILTTSAFAVALLWAGALALAFTLGHPAVTWIFCGALAAAGARRAGARAWPALKPNQRADTGAVY